MRTTIVLGLAITLGVIIAGSLGAWESWERRSIDWRYTVLPRPPAPMTDAIVHVDIDDGAMDQIGRWPDFWPRAKIASAIDELRRAGAKTIAVDLIFSDPSAASATQEGLRDNDVVLADAVREAQCVMPIDLFTGLTFGAAWSGANGRAALERALEWSLQDLTRMPTESADPPMLDSQQQVESHARQPLQFKRAAAWWWLGKHGGKLHSFEEFLAKVGNAHQGRVHPAYLGMLEQVWRQDRAWRALQPLLLNKSDDRGSYRDIAPLPEIARAAGSVGFVTVANQTDTDGSVRAIAATMAAPGGMSLQFGLAAAAAHAGIEAGDIEATSESVRLGETMIPLRNGKVWIDWPTSDTQPRWEGLLRQDDGAPSSAGHVSIREIVMLAEARAKQARNEESLEDLTSRILEFADIDATGDESIRAAADEVEFTLADAGDDQAPEDADEAELAFWDHVANCRLWLRLHDAVESGTAQIEQSSDTLSELVNGKLVFIGWTATSVAADFVTTAVGARTPGVVVHAAIANMALTGRHATFPPAWLTPVLALLVGLLATCAAACMRAWLSAVAVLAGIIAYIMLGGWLAFAYWSVVMPIVEPMLAGGVSWAACTALVAAVNQRQRAQITQQFRARVSGQLVDHLVSNPDALTVGGEQREMAIMFCDLAGFTSISEQLGGPRTVSTLNTYLRALTADVVSHGAYVNKFLGDGFMAFWSAFSDDPRQADEACAAALDLQRTVSRLNAMPEHAELPNLGLRIGIATGVVVVGDCGAPPELNDYTVIGDSVNLAARLESANKQFGTRILIDGRTHGALAGDSVRVRKLGRIVVVGQTTPIDTFEVVDDDVSPEDIETSSRVVESFESCRLDDARSALEQLVREHGETKFAMVYRDALDAAGEDFDGVLRLQSK